MLNVVAIQGRLVADPELRQTPQGLSVTSIRLACERNFVKPGEQRQADFVTAQCWRGTADFVCKYFKKGSMIVVRGCLQSRKYQDKSGNNREVLEIVAAEVDFCGGKDNTQAAPKAQYSAPQAPVASYSAGGVDDFAVIDDNEDLPF